MNILENQRERPFSPVGFARLSDCTGRRVSPKSFIIGSTVIITCETKSSRSPENQKSWRPG
jgi:hypothetical protein